MIGISLLALGEDIGQEMCLRSFDYLIQYSQSYLKRAIPLTLALDNVSNHKIEVIDRL